MEQWLIQDLKQWKYKLSLGWIVSKTKEELKGDVSSSLQKSSTNKGRKNDRSKKKITIL
jgi:hypothetical protein